MNENTQAQAHETADDERYFVHALASLAGETHQVLKYADTFALFNRAGDLPTSDSGGYGIYHDGTRHLSQLRLRIAGKRPLLLSSAVHTNNVLLMVDLTNPDLYNHEGALIPHGTLHFMRSKFLAAGVAYERMHIANHGDNKIKVELTLKYAADFIDVFEVRGTTRERRGDLRSPQLFDNGVQLAYLGLDKVIRRTHLEFNPPPHAFSETEAIYRLQLQAREACTLDIAISCDSDKQTQRPIPSFEVAQQQIKEEVIEYAKTTCGITSSNPKFNEWLGRATADLRMMITNTPTGPYPYAGVPWFSTPFGRDGILTALEALWFYPQLARGVLQYLAAHQAHSKNPRADAEPGKILHESRRGEMAALGEIPFGCYYGSVDATPLFVILAGEYFRATGDLDTVRDLWPNLQAALKWIDEFGDCDGDGFVEYGQNHHDGLLQQGWKDSHDSIFHADGTPATGPIALAEVQGYVYAARLAAAQIASALDKPQQSKTLRAAARKLRERFNQVFWCEELAAYALALDGNKQPCRVLTSNSGHCLYTGIADPDLAPRLAERLVSPEMFSGWGIRTLAASEQRYNPMSYHNGSVWPHDNAIIAAGLSRYGHKDFVLRLLNGMFDASQTVYLNRLPELFCGFTRRPGEGPTLYPVACSPQSWAAAAVFLMLQASMGLQVDGIRGRVCLDRPVLPDFLDWVTLEHLQVGPHIVTLRLHRHPEDTGIVVIDRSGPVEVVAVK